MSISGYFGWRARWVLALGVVVILWQAGCAVLDGMEGEQAGGSALAALVLDADALRLEVSDARQMSLTLQDAAGRALAPRAASWWSEDEAIAGVSAHGLVRAQAAGKTRIFAQIDHLRAEATVEVFRVARGLRIQPDVDTIAVGGELIFHAVALDKAGAPLSPQSVRWHASEAGYVTLEGGAGLMAHEVRVQGLSAGRVVLRAELIAPGVGATPGEGQPEVPVAEHPLTVETRALAGVELHLSRRTWMAGDEVTPELRLIDPSGHAYAYDGREVHWTSENPSVLGVTDQGGRMVLKALRPGEAVLRVQIDGDFQDAVEVSVVRWAHIGAGSGFSCGLLTDGRAYCWGDNAHGKLGVDDARGGTRARPSAVGDGLRFEAIALARDHACAVSRDGAVYCWGSRAYGQLGDGSGEVGIWAKPQRVRSDERFVEVGVGLRSSCGRSENNLVYCWGNNQYGQVGSGGAATIYTTPQRVAGAYTGVAVGGHHACALEQGSGVVYCWGFNGEGQVGAADAPNRVMTPQAVGPLDSMPRFVGLSAGLRHSCALTDDARVFCWGDNRRYDAGQPDATATFTTPVQVLTQERFGAIFSGFRGNCGLNEAAQAYCWGANAQGQLGAGDTSAMRLEHQPVAGGLRWAHVSLGETHACGVTADERTAGGYCWGSNQSGQLGTGAEVSSPVPVVVSVPAL